MRRGLVGGLRGLGVDQRGSISRRILQSPAADATVAGRFSRPEEVAGLFLYLASDQSANITGSDFTIDGGLVPTW